MLQRRREYVVLRAQGLPAASVRNLIGGEAGFVATSGLLAGTLVGLGLGVLLVDVLGPLFILQPRAAMPYGDIALLAGLVVAVTLLSTLVATSILRRLSPSEVLREQ